MMCIYGSSGTFVCRRGEKNIVKRKRKRFSSSIPVLVYFNERNKIPKNETEQKPNAMPEVTPKCQSEVLIVF